VCRQGAVAKVKARSMTMNQGLGGERVGVAGGFRDFREKNAHQNILWLRCFIGRCSKWSERMSTGQPTGAGNERDGEVGNDGVC